MNATIKKTGWYIRKSSQFPGSYYPVYVFEDGDERTFAQYAMTIEQCREMICENFEGGGAAPSRHTRISREDMAETLYRTCLSDPF